MKGGPGFVGGEMHVCAHLLGRTTNKLQQDCRNLRFGSPTEAKEQISAILLQPVACSARRRGGGGGVEAGGKGVGWNGGTDVDKCKHLPQEITCRLRETDEKHLAPENVLELHDNNMRACRLQGNRHAAMSIVQHQHCTRPKQWLNTGTGDVGKTTPRHSIKGIASCQTSTTVQS